MVWKKKLSEEDATRVSTERVLLGLLRSRTGPFRRQSALGGSPEGQSCPGRLGVLQEDNLSGKEQAAPCAVRLVWLTRELWLELGEETKVCPYLRKKGQAAQEDCRDFVMLCREKIRKAQSPART